MFRLSTIFLPLRGLFYLSLLLILVGCVSGSFEDLENQVTEIMSTPGGRIEPLPEIQPYEAYAYQAGNQGSRNPFELFYDQSVLTGQDEDQGIGLTEEMKKEIENRNREELERFELDSLAMVGTLDYEGGFWAIVLDPERAVHRVKVGNYVGKNIGKIISVTPDKIELREIIQNSQGRWEERQAALSLIETE